MNPFLSRLDKEFLLASDASTRAEINAKRAGYLARIGDFNSARAIIADLRSSYSDGRAGRVIIAIMIAEALIHHYEDLNPAGLDRIVRAQLLSRMLKDSRLEAITSAWRAHFEFESSMFRDMFISLKVAHDQAILSNCNDALTRVANIACKIALLCGEKEIASQQFLIGREKALLDGDQASIEALQHNKASFRLARLRSNMCLGAVDSQELREVGIEIGTAKTLQYLARINALATYIQLTQTHLFIVEGRMLEAAAALAEIRNAGPFPSGTFSKDLIDLELAFCLSSLDRCDEAFGIFSRIDRNSFDALDADERLYTNWMLLALVERDRRFGESEIARSDFQKAVAEYHSMIEGLRVGLRSIFVPAITT